MDEFSTITTNLKKITEQFEENKLQSYITKIPKYTAMQLHLSKEGYVDYDLFEKVLNLCVHEMEHDIKCTAIMLKIIMTILNKIKDEVYSPEPSILVPSAVCIIRKMNITATLSDVESRRDLYINTILLYPDDTLLALVSNYEALIVELFQSHNYGHLLLEYKILLYDLLHKLLTVLPSETKLSFMNSMTPIFFSKVIPSILDDISCITIENDLFNSLETLETITNELGEIDYFESPEWMSFMESICNTKKYPQMLKNLLDQNSQFWHRLWIVFIKLLKDQITNNIINCGTPINSMLPIVETAFKLDPKNRCRAFQCWTTLINIFSYETNENCINKRLKLLIIPLKLNNAKVEETAVAKFNSWWHLINKFQFKLEKFTEPILISFLHFCFGKPSSGSVKSTFIPGQLSGYLKEQSVKALVEIIGHVNCPGCVGLAKLKGQIINSKMLSNYWTDWTFSLKVAIQFSLCNNVNEFVPQHVLCLLQSFLITMSELPDNKIKDDIMSDLLPMLLKLVQDGKQRNNYYADTMLELLLSFFIEEVNMKDILSVKDEKRGTLYKIIKLTLDPCLKKFYERHDKREIVQKLKPLANYILRDPSGLQYVMDNVINSLPTNDIALTFWTTLVECIGESSENDFNSQNLLNLLLWPLESLNMFNEVKYPAKSWYTTYTVMHSKFKRVDFDRNVSEILNSSNIVTNSSIYFALHVTLAILKCGLMTENTNKYETDVQLLSVLLNRIDCYEHIEELFPVLVDTLIHILQCYTISNIEDLAETIISCVKNVLKLMVPVFKTRFDVTEISTIMQNLLNAVDLAFKSEIYSKLFYILSDFITLYSTIFPKLALSIYTKSSCIDKNCEIYVEEKVSTKQTTENRDFFTPSTKEVKKKRKKTEDSVVNTVLENGEEYVVVQSNWKFNPKKLTENQKEKLQRKREDIPALYQDLSQSQDDINLKSWKTDSQDTTASNSGSKSRNEGKDASSILKKLPSTELVPKILENILLEVGNNESDPAHKELTKTNNKIDKPLTNKNCGQFRITLKDRVVRNFRNLIENSKIESNSECRDSMYNQTENICRTPSPDKVKTADIIGLVKSAPPLPSSERPTRVKRTPKKFDDTKLFDITKRRLHNHGHKNDANVNENLSINNTDDGRKYENDCVKGNSSIIEKMQVDLITKNIESTESIVNSKPVIENTDCVQLSALPVKVVENYTDKLTDKTNCLKVKVSQDEKGNQPHSPQEQESKNEYLSSLNLSEQKSHDKKYVHKSSEKTNNNKRKSRIENELAINMAIEYHNKTILSDKRLTRKKLATTVNTSKRRRLTDKLKQSPLESKVTSKQSKNEKPVRKYPGKVKVIETQDESSTQENMLLDDGSSEDIIESSQDSTLTTCTVIKKTPKKIPIVRIESIQLEPKLYKNITATKNLSQERSEEIILKSSNVQENESFNNIALENEACAVSIEKDALDKTKEIDTASVMNLLNDTDCQNTKLDSLLINEQSKDDTELPQNKTDARNNSQTDLTENMNTEEICNSDLSDVALIDDEEITVTISNDENVIEIGTQETADAATQPVNPADLLCSQSGVYDNTTTPESLNNDINENAPETGAMDIQNNDNNTESNNNKSIITTTTADIDAADHNSSPFKDELERKQDFMNNTLEISPIKTLSPNNCDENPHESNENKTPEYVVIVLSSPVRSNGEPVDRESPEVFTEDKTSADKIECSPTRTEINNTNTSPSSALSLKKNRPQARGRAAQMLGLCIPEKLNSLVCSDRNDTEVIKKNSLLNTPVRRNLRMLYNSTSDDIAMDNEENENFLTMNRLLPPIGSSPSGPILKRKHADITDDATVSPANKRKRVSFHDPPVSTTVSVQKYIEPLGVRSPQNSAQKRHERQLRSQNGLKSPRRLDSVFNLNSALSNVVQSFTGNDLTATNDDHDDDDNSDTPMTSLEQTPSAEIVKTGELNDTEPICSVLLDCKVPIEIIAGELSSVAMKPLLVKELEGRIETIGDLAKMTEVEVNRLCIKSPKVKVAKRALNDYYSKSNDRDNKIDNAVTIIDAELVKDSNDSKIGNVETQTDKIICHDAGVQTTVVPLATNSMQTEVTSTSIAGVQTDESGFKSTGDIIKTCLLERDDFLDQLTKQLGETEMGEVVERLPFEATTDLYMKRINESNANVALSRLLDHTSVQRSSDRDSDKKNQLSFIRDYLQQKFSSKDLNLFCIQLLLELHNKSS